VENSIDNDGVDTKAVQRSTSSSTTHLKMKREENSPNQHATRQTLKQQLKQEINLIFQEHPDDIMSAINVFSAKFEDMTDGEDFAVQRQAISLIEAAMARHQQEHEGTQGRNMN